MKRQTKRHRIIATFFLLIFFPTLVPNNLFASNNGPKSPEAASFEPVDATDMVNLITGQYSYVLPLLNVPSPEGGYPVAMGYHAGIAMDQEASWAGLGWNVNPGAIDRSVNGYADDYETSTINEYFYDSGGKEYQSFVSANFSNGAVSAGLGFNWGSNQSLGGAVSLGYGFDLGGETSLGVTGSIGFGNDSGKASLSAGLRLSSGLTLGASMGSGGNIEASAGFSDNNGTGFRISTSGNVNLLIGGSKSLSGSSVGITLSSSGGGVTMGGQGVGISSSFKSTVSAGDYCTNLTSWNASIPIPTPIGFFSLSFGKQEFTYWLNKNVTTYVTGPLKYNQVNYSVSWYDSSSFLPDDGRRHPYGGVVNGVNGYYSSYGTQSFDTQEELSYFVSNCSVSHPTYVLGQQTSGSISYNDFKTKFFDINEIPSQNNSSSSLDVSNNNLTFPNYDNFNVQAQGISGSMKATIYENGTLFGLSDRDNSKGYTLKYYNDNSGSIDATSKFDDKPFFYFDNEISSYLNVDEAQFNQNISNSLVNNHYSNGVALEGKPRNKTSNFIEYYTNNQIVNSYDILKSQGYLQPNTTGVDRNSMPGIGVGAFKITSVDGKTYHYSLPVYNKEIITRTFGSISERKQESQSYFEKRQLEPFATHWLLTAVTGPDFVDNGDGVAGEGDLGYWVSFDYGKWSDAFVWKAPFKKDYIKDEKNPDIKTWIRGRKELYYLDKIKTRTHTALFIKSERSDSPSETWNYSSVIESSGYSVGPGSYLSRMTIPGHNQLKLDKIILLKNEDAIIDKAYGTDSNSVANINYNKDYPTEIQTTTRRLILTRPGYVDNKIENAKYSVFDNVLDLGDNWQASVVKAIKVIDLNYDYSLVPGDNRLTLKSVNFKGKGGASVLPPYKFDYINDANTFNIDNQDGWGYNTTNSASFSLNKITTPQGGTIDIIYGSNKFRSVNPAILEFSNDNSLNYTSTLPNPSPSSSTDQTAKKVIISLGSNQSYPITLGKIVAVNYLSKVILPGGGGTSSETTRSYIGNGQITSLPSSLGIGNYEVTFDEYPSSAITNIIPGELYASNQNINIKIELDNSSTFTGGGSRVESLKISDGINNYFTDYKYGQNEDGVGYVSYVPYAQYVAKEVPYSAELPAPRVMYEYITMSSHKDGEISEGKIRYKFNIMKSKDPDKIKYGNFYEIIENKQPSFTNTNSDTNVNISSFVVKDNLASIGQLLEVVNFNIQGHQLSKISNSYYGMDDNSTNMGVSQESYQTYKTVDYVTNTSTVKDKWIINSSTRIKYPSIIKSSTEQKNGYIYTTQFNDYDLVSGISKEQVYTSSDGQSYKTRIVPAYTIPQYNPSGGYGMGSKVDNPTNKNMLSQTAAEYSYILDKGSNTWKETGVGITTWSNIWSYKDSAGETTAPPTADKEKIWRKHKTFVWNGVKDGDGIFSNYNKVTDDGFDWTIGVGSQPSKWKQISETTLYNHFSTPLEMKDINNNYASTKMDYNDSKILAVGNGRYGEIFYTGGENNWLGSGISGGSIYNGGFHTGKNLIIASTSSPLTVSMKNSEHRAGKYKLSVWVKYDHASRAALNVNGNVIPFVTDNISAGGWQLKTAYIDVPSSACTIALTSNTGNAVYYDDLMIRPVASSITGYVYNEWDELSYIVGNNGLATKFEYDAAGRLIKTYSEYVAADDFGGGGFKLSKTNTYYNRFL